VRVVTCAVVALVLVALAVIQVASDAFAAPVAAPFSLPRYAPTPFALAVYQALDRAAPSDFVEATLAQYALQRGDVADAKRHAVRLAPSSTRDELLGQIALRRGDRGLALTYFLAAPDIGELQGETMRLAHLQTHPDAVAEADWIMGRIAQRVAARMPAARLAWLTRAREDDLAAATMAPFSEKYLLAIASAELRLGDRRAARRWYRRLRSVDPSAQLH
jgi:hypothetical protein